jgi:3-phenylpropionate/trans-cinnamate dioxygenase ferredoxin reductase subunit
MNSRIVIVGAGQAAAQAIETLRKRGHLGSITLIGDEDLLPYQRPPLSKKYLAGGLERDRLLIRHVDHYLSQRVELKLGFAVVAIDRARRHVEITDGTAVEYDRLLLATGSRPRLLPQEWETARPFYLRTANDVERLREQMAPGRRALIIGGGYIGLEAAATFREAGLEVTVHEAADRVMARVVSPVVSRFYEAEHARQGVEILLAVPVVPGRDNRDSRD